MHQTSVSSWLLISFQPLISVKVLCLYLALDKFKSQKIGCLKGTASRGNGQPVRGFLISSLDINVNIPHMCKFMFLNPLLDVALIKYLRSF